MLKLTDFNAVLIQYVKNKKGQRIGVVVAIDKDVLGWSLCNSTSNWLHSADTFDKEKGIGIALSRADFVSTLDEEESEGYYLGIPQSCKKVFDKVRFRSQDYFKHDEA